MKYLERRLSLAAVIAISISSMLGSGIFVLPGVAFSFSGPSLWLAYLIGAVCVFPAALSKSELATAMPASGGTYIYIERTFGPCAGTIAGLGLWLAVLLKSAFALVGIGAYLSILTDLPLQSTALVLLTGIVALNILGIGKVSSVLIYVVVVSLLSLIGLSGVGMYQFEPALMADPFPKGLHAVFQTAGLVFVSYAGVTKIAAIAEEVKNPNKNLPLGIMISLIIVTIIYCVVTFVMAGNLPIETISGDLKPVYTFGVKLGGKWLGVFAAVIAIATMGSMANAGLLAASRFPFAMSRDKLLPSILGTLNPKFLTPVISIIASGVMIATAIAFLNVEKIAKLASAFLIMMFILENLTVVILREMRVRWYQPGYRSPLYPFVQIVGVLSGLYLLVSMGSVAILAAAGAGIPGAVLYFVYSQFRTERRGVIGNRGIRKDLTEPDQEDPLVQEYHDAEVNAQVVVALFGQERSPEMVTEMGLALADKGKLEVVYITEIPEQTGLQDITDETPEVNSLARRIGMMSAKTNSDIEFEHFYCHDLYKTVHEISRRFHCMWLVKEWGGRTKGAFTVNNHMHWLENHLACHLMTFRDAGVRYINKICICVEPGLEDPLVVDTTDHLAVVENAEITFLSILSFEADDAQVLKQELSLRNLAKVCSRPTHIDVRRAVGHVQGIIDASKDFDLLVLRDQREHSKLSRWFGTSQDRIMAKASCSVASVLPAGSH